MVDGVFLVLEHARLGLGKSEGLLVRAGFGLGAVNGRGHLALMEHVGYLLTQHLLTGSKVTLQLLNLLTLAAQLNHLHLQLKCANMCLNSLKCIANMDDM